MTTFLPLTVAHHNRLLCKNTRTYLLTKVHISTKSNDAGSMCYSWGRMAANDLSWTSTVEEYSQTQESLMQRKLHLFGCN